MHYNFEGSFVSLSKFVRNFIKAFPWDSAVISIKMWHVPLGVSASILVEWRSLEQDHEHVHSNAEYVIFFRGISVPWVALRRPVVGSSNICIIGRNIGLHWVREVDQSKPKAVSDNIVIWLQIAMGKSIYLMKVGYRSDHLGAKILFESIRQIPSNTRPIVLVSLHQKVKKGPMLAEGSH
jgi:hypothetical protein